MAEQCNQDCGSCNEECEQRDLRVKPNARTTIGHVVAVMSGKGGVGKSMVTSLLAAAMNKQGYRTAVLDADITGPSIPKAFGIKDKARGTEGNIEPNVSGNGVKIMSINLLLEDETAPVLWRGPLLAGTVKQFFTDVSWGDIDYLFIDMPPGTGDVPLTIFQSLPVDGIVMVTSPQELVSMIVSKAVKMANMMEVPIIGVVENMSYFVCPDNGKHYDIFGKSHIEEIAGTYDLPLLAKIPIDPAISEACDAGTIEAYDASFFDDVVSHMKKSMESNT